VHPHDQHQKHVLYNKFNSPEFNFPEWYLSKLR